MGERLVIDLEACELLPDTGYLGFFPKETLFLQRFDNDGRHGVVQSLDVAVLSEHAFNREVHLPHSGDSIIHDCRYS